MAAAGLIRDITYGAKKRRVVDPAKFDISMYVAAPRHLILYAWNTKRVTVMAHHMFHVLERCSEIVVMFCVCDTHGHVHALTLTFGAYRRQKPLLR